MWLTLRSDHAVCYCSQHSGRKGFSGLFFDGKWFTQGLFLLEIMRLGSSSPRHSSSWGKDNMFLPLLISHAKSIRQLNLTLTLALGQHFLLREDRVGTHNSFLQYLTAIPSSRHLLPDLHSASSGPMKIKLFLFKWLKQMKTLGNCIQKHFQSHEILLYDKQNLLSKNNLFNFLQIKCWWLSKWKQR